MMMMMMIKPFTSVTHQYVNNVFSVTVKITFVMPYHGLMVYFKLKRFTWFEVSTSVINTVITEKKSSFFNRRK